MLVKKSFVVVLTLVILLTNLLVVFNGLFVYKFLWDVTGVDEAAALPFTEKTLAYLNGGSELPDGLTEREITHLEDVQQVVTKGKLLYIVAIVALAGLIFATQLTLQTLRYIYRRAALLVALLPLVTALLFNWTFTWFHQLLFDPGSWVFDPATTTLVNMYPMGFFIGMFAVYALLGLVWAALLTVTTWKTTHSDVTLE